MQGLTLDAQALYAEWLPQVKARIHPHTHLVGIISGGLWLARRLRHDLGLTQPVGQISSAMHRDDFSKRGLADGGQTMLPFEVNGADILLLDDVLYTGRTTRAVLNELFDYGRPARIQLAVLVDRGGRELPIQPDLAAARVNLRSDQSLALEQDAQGRFAFQIETLA